MKVSAIITAAGLGKRMGSQTPKQFLKLNGKPIISHTIEKFESSHLVDFISIVTDSAWISESETLLRNLNLTKKWRVVAGGDVRQDSVLNGLKSIPPDTEIVVVHDGVRPFISPEVIDRSIKTARENGSCIVAVPLKDTIKKGNDKIVETVDRSGLWAAQTPQTFRYDILKDAFDRAYESNFYGTDEAMLVERIGEPVMLLNGSYKNIKITTPEDMEIAEAFVKEAENANRNRL